MKKRIVLIAIILSVLFIVACIFILVGRAGKIAVEVSVLPEDAIVTLDGKVIGSGTLYLTEGDHVFKASKKGWSDDTQTLMITSDINQVALLPEPNSTSARNLLSQSDFSAKREALGQIRADSRGKTFRVKNTITKHLPYSDIAGPFKIDYGYNGRTKEEGIYLIISHSTPTGRKRALSWLRSLNEDPTNYTIVFSGYKSPLDGSISPTYNYTPTPTPVIPEEEDD